MGISHKSTKKKTRRRTRDLDQIKSDLLYPKHLAQYKNSKAMEDLPGLGRWYCIECAKWFEAENSLVTHCKGKIHKRRAKALRDDPYTQKEAEAAVSLGTDNGSYYKATKFVEDVDVEIDIT